jgi:hypothetical protein
MSESKKTYNTRGNSKSKSANEEFANTGGIGQPFRAAHTFVPETSFSKATAEEGGFEPVTGQKSNKKQKKIANNSDNKDREEYNRAVLESQGKLKGPSPIQSTSTQESHEDNNPDKMDVDPNVTPTNPKDQTNTVIIDNHDDPKVEIFEKPKFPKVKINVEQVQGLNFKKKKIVSEFLKGMGVIPVNLYYDNKEKCVICTPNTQDTYDRILKAELTIHQKVQSEETDGQVEQELKLKFVTCEEKAKQTDDQINEWKERTIQLVNVPLNIQNFQLRTVFGQFGNITEFYTKVKGNYLTAYITYDNKQPIQEFYDKVWSFYVGRFSVGIFPMLLSPEKRKKRNEHILKLSGLPANTHAMDLMLISQAINAKYVFIPRHPKTNRSLKHAYIYF